VKQNQEIKTPVVGDILNELIFLTEIEAEISKKIDIQSKIC
jgi:hypothetical protein